MNKTILLTALVALTLFSCKKSETTTTTNSTTTAAAGPEREAVRAEIQKLEDGYAAAMNAKNIDGLADYYAADAKSYLTGSSMVSGQEAILASTKADFEKMPKDAKVEYTMTDLFISNDGEQVVETGSYRTSDKSTGLKRKGNFMAVFEKRDGKYVCVRDIDAPQ